MLDDDLLACRTIGTAIQMAKQLVDDDGGRATRVVVHRAPAVREYEAILSREKEIEKELPVVASQVTVAFARFESQQVERRASIAARERLVVESDYGDDAKRNAAHRFQRGHRHAADQEARAEAIVGELCFEPIAHDAERHVVMMSGYFCERAELANHACYLAQRLLIVPVCGMQKSLRGIEERGTPLRDWTPRAPRGERGGEFINPRREPTQRCRIAGGVAGFR